jgi:hypothetical protein
MDELSYSSGAPPMFDKREFRMTLLTFHEELDITVSCRFAISGDKNDSKAL